MFQMSLLALLALCGYTFCEANAEKKCFNRVGQTAPAAEGLLDRKVLETFFPSVMSYQMNPIPISLLALLALCGYTFCEANAFPAYSLSLCEKNGSFSPLIS
jgi:hypothetical protein